MSLSLNFKPTDPVPLDKTVAEYFASSNAVDFQKYEADIKELHQLRVECQTPEVHENSLNKLLRYYGQLCAVSAKLPIEENAIRLNFRWYSAFEKGRKKPGKFLYKSRKISSFSVTSEKAHVLFNVGVMYNLLGSQSFQQRGNAEALKKSARYFQLAAGVFEEIKSLYSGTLQSISTGSVAVELQAHVLTVLVNVHLALAQECFVHKAILDQKLENKVKDGTISKLAAKCAEMYSEALVQTNEGGKSVYGSDFLSALNLKIFYLNAIAYQRKASDVFAQNKFGLQVAFLKAAIGQYKKALDLKYANQNLNAEIKDLMEGCQVQLKRAEKDNDVIYLEIVPEENNLPVLEKAALAQVAAFKLDDYKAVIGRELFKGLTPAAVQQQLQIYNDRKQNIVKAILDSAAHSDSNYNTFLAGMGLPGALQAFLQPQGIPADILEKSNEIRANGGAQGIKQNLMTLNMLSSEDKKIIEEIEFALNEEEKEDLECRNTFREKWIRTPSNVLQQELKEKVKVNKEKLKAAGDSDVLVLKKFEKSIHYIDALSGSKDELEATIPASVASTNHQLREPAVQNLHSVLQAGNDLQRRRSEVVTKLKQLQSQDDITTALLEHFGRGESNYETLFQQQLQKYEAFDNAVKETIQNQTNWTDQVKHCHEEFKKVVKENDTFKQRQGALQNLALGYAAFKELSENFKEGIAFYSKLGEILRTLKGRVTDFAAARGLEKKELLRDISQSAASGNPYQQPQPPTYPQQFNQVPGYYSNQPAAAPPAPMYSQQPLPNAQWDPSRPVYYNNNAQAMPQPQAYNPQGQQPGQGPYYFRPPQ